MHRTILFCLVLLAPASTTIAALLPDDAASEISRTFRFKNYYETMAFVNALAWVAHREDHHPNIEVGYNRAHVRFSTHSVKGLSQNYFICAAKLNALLGNSVTAPGVTLPPTSL